MDNKTKDALKQLQTEMRHLQSLVSEGRLERKSETTMPDEAPAPGKPKSDVVVQYAINHPASGAGDASYKSGAVTVTAPQLTKVSDDAAALLGYALSSPQKVSLLRALLYRESESASALGVTAHLSTGSLYHHLRDLMHAGLIAQAGRNQYHITSHGRRVLLLVLALAAEG